MYSRVEMKRGDLLLSWEEDEDKQTACILVHHIHPFIFLVLALFLDSHRGFLLHSICKLNIVGVRL